MNSNVNIFQEGSIQIENAQSREEDEELEEQRRRQEELADLLATGIHAFNYDESTMNSSATSFEGTTEQNDKEINNPLELKFNPSERKGTNSPINLSNVEQTYKNASHQDQLKVLYDVRVREMQSLRAEFDKYQAEKSKEIGILKNKSTLLEAELRHSQVSLTNAESLLVEKTEIINKLKQDVICKDQEVENLKKKVDELNLEICTYSSTVNELQLKLADNHPFSAGVRKSKSEELQRVHQDQIIKLETFLQEQSKKVQILEKEKLRLSDDLKKLIAIKNEQDEENNLTIMALSKKLQSSQQQCRDLFLLGEAIKKESDHFKERMQQLEVSKLDLSGDGFKIKTMDKETMIVHLEKLRRMLLDKEVEMNTLKAKLKFYDSDLQELFEYREILSKMYSCEVKPCNNREHEEMLIFMQRQLQSYQQAVEDRNNQIMNLNIKNNKLEEEIEDMIQKTRTDIKNLSEKYSLPQLETMSNELKNAELTINELKQQLMEKNKIDKIAQDELVTKLEKAQKHIDHLEQMAIREKQNFEEILAETKDDLKKLEVERAELKELIEKLKNSKAELTEENSKIKNELQNICLKLGVTRSDMVESDCDAREMDLLKSKYGQVHDQLHQVALQLEKVNLKRENINIICKLKKQILNYLSSMNTSHIDRAEIEEKLKMWTNLLSDFIENSPVDNTNEEMEKDNVQDLINAKTMLEGEKFALEYEIKSRNNELESAKKEIEILKENRDALVKKSIDNVEIIQQLNDELNDLKKYVKLVEANKAELEQQLENMQKQLNEVKEETIELHKEVNEVNENAVQENLLKALKDVENALERGKSDTDVSGTEIFQKCLQAQVLKAELAIRERLQEESINKMEKIEERYKKVLVENTEIFNKEKEKWKNREAMYRKQFAAVLEECGKKMEELEKDNVSLMKQINELINEYGTFKMNTAKNAEKCKQMISESKKDVGLLNQKWENLVEYYMANVTKIEKQSQNSINSLFKKINTNEREIEFIQRMYDDKMNNYKLGRINISKKCDNKN